MSNRQKLQSKKITQKLQSQVQHLKHLQNLLLSQNKKLKQQVNNRRKERVIYSNIFKKYQKDIRIWEDKYKECLLDNLATQDAEKKIKEKIFKLKRKFQKDIKILEQIKTEKQAEKQMLGLNSSKQNNGGITGNKTSKTNINSSKRTLGAGESYKRLISQKQIQLKTKQQQAEYQKQSKYIIFQQLAEQLKKIAQTQDLNQAVEVYNTVDERTQKIYQKYTELQKIKKEKQQQIHELQSVISVKQSLSVRGTSKNLQFKDSQEMSVLQQKMKQQKQRITKLQNQLSEKLDINCRKLQNDQLKPFIERIITSRNNQQLLKSQEQINGIRIREKAPITKYKPVNVSGSPSSKHNNHAQAQSPEMKNMKNMLQKKLEEIEKEKTVDNYLLSYNEINRAMLKHYCTNDKK